MSAVGVPDRGLELSDDQRRALAGRLRGALLGPADPGYDESRSVWNAMIDRRPAAVVRCAGVADIVAALAFARSEGLLVAIKGGGHNIAGLAVADGALLLDLSPMRGVWVDPAQRRARAQAGCLLGDLDRETQLHGLAAVLGFVSMTGIAGLTLGGGFGYLSRRFGWTTDTLQGVDLVTAEGRLVRASETENADLFWALRGGGGNFGVATSFDYALYPVGPEIVGGVVAWPASEAPGVLALYRELAEAAPRELTLVCFIRPAPPAPWLPKEQHGRPIVAILACHSGSPEDGERAVAPIKAHGKPIGDILVRRPYAQLQALLDGTQPKGRRYYWKSEYLPAVTEELCEDFMAQAATIPSPHSAAILFQLGGAVGDLPAAHSPVGNRDARYVLNLSSAWEDAREDEANIAWARESWAKLRRYSTGGTYLNFLNAEEGTERTQDALGPALARLAEAKRRWDPENVFRTNRNIAPA